MSAEWEAQVARAREDLEAAAKRYSEASFASDVHRIAAGLDLSALPGLAAYFASQNGGTLAFRAVLAADELYAAASRFTHAYEDDR